MFDPSDTMTKAAATAGELAVSCVDAAHASVSVAAAMPVEGLDGAQLRDLALQLEQLRRMLDATEHHALAELDRRRHTELHRGAATSKWLAHGAHLPAGVARARLSLAKRLAQDPALQPVARALDLGDVSADHARVLAGAINERNAASLAPALDDLLQAAQAMVFDVWKAHVEHLAEMADPDGRHDPEADLLANTLRLSPSNDFLLLRGELVGEHAICVADVLDAVADELFHQFARDAERSEGALGVPPRSTLMALALEEVCRRAIATDTATTAKPRVEASLVIHAERRDDHLDIWAVHHRILGPLPIDVLPTFLHDATFYATMLDSLGLPVDLGGAQRHPSAARLRCARRLAGCTPPATLERPWPDRPVQPGAVVPSPPPAASRAGPPAVGSGSTSREGGPE